MLCAMCMLLQFGMFAWDNDGSQWRVPRPSCELLEQVSNHLELLDSI